MKLTYETNTFITNENKTKHCVIARVWWVMQTDLEQFCIFRIFFQLLVYLVNFLTILNQYFVEGRQANSSLCGAFRCLYIFCVSSFVDSTIIMGDSCTTNHSAQLFWMPSGWPQVPSQLFYITFLWWLLGVPVQHP